MDCRFAVLVVFTATLVGGQVLPYYPRPVVPGGAYVPIIAQNYDLNPDGSYVFNYESADGSARDETAVVRGVGPEGPILGVQGSYRYGPVVVSYIADENGFQPSGDTVHPSIQKAVAQQVAEAQARPLGPGLGALPYRRY